MDQKKRICTCGKTKTPPYCDHHSHSHPRPKLSPLKISLIPNKILLMMLPYWDPLIPPQGIASLKSFLDKHGYWVKTLDLNVVTEFKELYNRYFETLKEYIPGDKRGNFYNIGHDVLQNHMMAHINYNEKSESEYIQLIMILIEQTFFVSVGEHQVRELDQILDAFYRTLERDFLVLLEKERPSVVGVSVYRGNLPASLFILRLTRQKYPDIGTVMGGGIFADNLAVGSPNYEKLLETTKDYIDKIIIGQGEKLFLKYLRHEIPESVRVVTLKNLNLEPLDFSSMDIPDLTDFDLPQYPYMAATGSVSCPNQCSFCNVAIFSGKFRVKDPAQTVAEMIQRYQAYRSQLFFMTDSLLNPIIDDLALELMKEEVSLYYDCYFRVDKNCHLEKAFSWRRSGLYRVRLGVESGSQRVLDSIDKGITIEQTRATVTNLAYAGVKTTAYWVVGHPGETEEDFQQTLNLLEELKNDIYEAECNPFTYHYTGQSHSDRWQSRRKLLYPETAKDLLIAQTWVVDGHPSRKVQYERLYRFVNHCQKLGVPNPYSLHEIYHADERWKKLHKHAVPPLTDLLNKKLYVDESKKVKQVLMVQDSQLFEEEFEF